MTKKVVALPIVLLLLFFLMTGCEIFEPQTLPIGVVMVTDVSGSMRGSPMDHSIEGMKAFISNFDMSKDQVALVEFDANVNVVVEFGPVNRDDNNSGRLDIIEAIEGLSTGSGTALWNGAMQGLAIARDNNAAGISMGVLVFTDGRNNRGPSTESDVIQKAQQNNLPVFVIGLGNYDEASLSRVASETGGLFYGTPSPEELEEIYLELFKQIQQRAEVSTYL